MIYTLSMCSFLLKRRIRTIRKIKPTRDAFVVKEPALVRSKFLNFPFLMQLVMPSVCFKLNSVPETIKSTSEGCIGGLLYPNLYNHSNNLFVCVCKRGGGCLKSAVSSAKVS